SRSRTSSACRRDLSAPAKSSKTSPHSTAAILSRTWCSKSEQRYRTAGGRNYTSSAGPRFRWLHLEVHCAQGRAARAVAHVPDQVPDLHGLLGHEQDDGP